MLVFDAHAASLSNVQVNGVGVKVVAVGRDVQDPQGVLAQRYDGQSGTAYLIRPDQHVAARWRSLDATQVQQALARALALA